MHSRSLLLLKRDYQIINSDRHEGISAQLSTENYFKWRLIFPALDETIWTGGEYRILIQFPPNYNTFPPEIRFLTIPYHPNIDPTTGLVTLPLLLPTHWSEANSVIDIVLALQQLLSEPYLQNGCVLNQEAASCYTETPSMYRQIAQDCVVASIKISAGIAPYIQEAESPVHTPKSEVTSVKKEIEPSASVAAQVQHVSYSDYISIWSDLATTKARRKKRDSPNHPNTVRQEKHHEANENQIKTAEQTDKDLSPRGIANISVDKRVK